MTSEVRSKRSWRADRSKVARLQKYETHYVAHKYDLPQEAIAEIVRFAGNNRKAIYALAGLVCRILKK